MVARDAMFQDTSRLLSGSIFCSDRICSDFCVGLPFDINIILKILINFVGFDQVSCSFKGNMPQLQNQG